MLEGIFGNASAEKILLYLEQYEEGYATAIARTFDDLSLNMAQRQLERFERAERYDRIAGAAFIFMEVGLVMATYQIFF